MTASRTRPCCLKASSPYKQHGLRGLRLTASCPHTTGQGMRVEKVAARPHSTALKGLPCHLHPWRQAGPLEESERHFSCLPTLKPHGMTPWVMPAPSTGSIWVEHDVGTHSSSRRTLLP